MEDNGSCTLRDAALATLTEPSLALLEKLEAHAEQHIRFARHVVPAAAGDPNPDAPACEINSRGATIRLREGAPISAQGVTHELLHLARWWLDGVPQLYPAHSAFKRTCENLENAIEHLTIVPREALYGFEPYGYWNRTYREIWSSAPLTSAMSPDVRRNTCLLAWLATSHISDGRVIALIEQGVRAEGLFAQAESFKRTVIELLSNKSTTVAYVVHALNIPEDAVLLRFYDASASTVRDEPLPHRF